MINFPSADKLILLAVIALVVLGPTRLPGAARSVGKVVGDLRRVMGRFQDEVHGALADPTDVFASAIGDLRSEVGGLRSDLGGFAQKAPTTTSIATEPSSMAADAVPSAWTRPGLPPLPPAPDDPSLN